MYDEPIKRLAHPPDSPQASPQPHAASVPLPRYPAPDAVPSPTEVVPQLRLHRRTGDADRAAWLRRLAHQSTGIKVSMGVGALLAVCALCAVLIASLGAGGSHNQRSLVAISPQPATASLSYASVPGTPLDTTPSAASATETAVPVPATPPAHPQQPVAAQPPAPPLAPPAPPAAPPPAATATPTPCATPNCNPWGYDFTPGTQITAPPATFCQVFACIGAPTYKSFTDGTGYVVECADATYSKSGGETGVCSNHGGYLRTLYAH